MVIVDGKEYADAGSAPDIGEWKCTHVEAGFTGSRRFYQGKSTDVSKLPTNDAPFNYSESYLGEGSRAFCLDTKEEYTYHVYDKTWYKLP